MQAVGRVVLAALLGICLFPQSGSAAGTVESHFVDCPSVGGAREFRVYVPDGYADSGQAYPVVYWLPGTTYTLDIYWSWGGFQSRLDALIASGAIPPILFVTPDGLDEYFEHGCWYVDSELYGNGEDYIAVDLVQWMDDNFRTIPGREFRALCGHSMGGFGAPWVALRNADVFGAVIPTAGVLDLHGAVLFAQEVLVGEAGAGPPYEYHPTNGDDSRNTFSKAGAWSPNLDNPPYLVDLPVDGFGEFIDEVVDRWMAFDAAEMADYYVETWADTHPLAIWIGCALGDGLLDDSEYFSEVLTARGIEHIFETYPGDHLTLPFNDYITWLFDAGVVGVADPSIDRQDRRLIVCPNPVKDARFVNLSFPGLRPDAVQVFDAGGRQVRMLHPRGASEFTWDLSTSGGGRAAAGVYFLRLTHPGGAAVQKLVIGR